VALRTFTRIKSAIKGHRHLYVDAKNAKEILAFLNRDDQVRKKFWHVVELVLNHQYTTEIFELESVNKDTIDVYALKLKIGLNPRIHCKTYQIESGFHIILAELEPHKSTQKLTKRLRTIIEKVANYEYEIK
jgi:hypothetical protein